MARDYDSTIARIAGNIMPGLLTIAKDDQFEDVERLLVPVAVDLARRIVAEVRRTEPAQPSFIPYDPKVPGDYERALKAASRGLNDAQD